MFNTKDGFLEATVRGYVGGFLRTEDYSNLQQCETVEDIKLYLVIPISRSNFEQITLMGRLVQIMVLYYKMKHPQHIHL